jgi:16S rRNA (guanine(966)-N(2))-methyltransferase RsmD
MRIIAGDARGRIIDAPSGLHTRPTLDRVRENLFNIIQGEVSGSRVLDLFAGSGALSLEALSRGADSAVLVDSDRRAFQVQQKNIRTLGYQERTRQYCCDWRKALADLKREETGFDLVFLDPPYAMLDLKEVFEALIPFIGTDTLVILEHKAGSETNVSGRYRLIKQRSWGFCAVSVYRLHMEGE